MSGLLSVLLVGIWIFGIVDVVVTDKTAVRNLPKWAWFGVVVVFFAGIGALAWFLFGRPTRPFTTRAESSPAPPARPVPPRRVRPTRAERAEEEAELRARIEERDRMLAQWAEEDRRKAAEGRGQAEDSPAP